MTGLAESNGSLLLMTSVGCVPQKMEVVLKTMRVFV